MLSSCHELIHVFAPLKNYLARAGSVIFVTRGTEHCELRRDEQYLGPEAAISQTNHS